MIAQETFTLANGVAIPKLGFGTWMIDDREVAGLVQQCLWRPATAMSTPPKPTPTNAASGKGCAPAASRAATFFVTTKLAAECKSYSEAKALIDVSLATLGVGHIDLMLIHSPQPWAEFRKGEHYFAGNLEAWRALEEGHAAGKLRAIGVSNFEQVDIDNIIENAAVKPAVNQILAHVGNTPFDLIDHCRSRNVLVEAYSPVAHGARPDQSNTGRARRQIRCLRRAALHSVLPGARAPAAAKDHPSLEHLRSNIAVDFEITAEDMATLKAIEARRLRRSVQVSGVREEPMTFAMG